MKKEYQPRTDLVKKFLKLLKYEVITIKLKFQENMKEKIKSKISDELYPNELVRDLDDINNLIQEKREELEKLKTRDEVVSATSKIVRSYYDKR